MRQESKEEIKAGERIAKVIARAGICSRRDAERYIAEGRVNLNGKILETPACLVTESDVILVDGKPLPGKQDTKLFLYHKPSGLVTTHKDEKNRKTVFEDLPKELPRLISVGRLDLNTEGLLLLTNDGALSRYLELPSTGWTRRYRVRVYGHVQQKDLDKLKRGITYEGVRYGSIQAELETQKQAGNQWLNVAIKEGKNREVRKIMEAIGLKANRLIRVAYGPFQLGHLPKGEIVEVKPKTLKEQLGKFFKEAG